MTREFVGVVRADEAVRHHELQDVLEAQPPILRMERRCGRRPGHGGLMRAWHRATVHQRSETPNRTRPPSARTPEALRSGRNNRPLRGQRSAVASIALHFRRPRTKTSPMRPYPRFLPRRRSVLAVALATA